MQASVFCSPADDTCQVGYEVGAWIRPENRRSSIMATDRDRSGGLLVCFDVIVYKAEMRKPLLNSTWGDSADESLQLLVCQEEEYEYGAGCKDQKSKTHTDAPIEFPHKLRHTRAINLSYSTA